MAASASSLSAKPKHFSQGQLNDLVCDLGLSKELYEITLLCNIFVTVFMQLQAAVYLFFL